MATKLGRVVTYEKKNSPVMSDDPSITRSRKAKFGYQTFQGTGIW